MEHPRGALARRSPAGGGARYPEIASYAVLGDSRTAALLGADGRIDWACFPDFSSTAWFGALLDRDRGGVFSLFPEGALRVARAYLPGTPVLRTRVETGGGVAILTDAMSALDDRSDGLEPQSEILRRVEVVAGEVEVALHVEPRRDYGRGPLRIADRGVLGWAFGARGHAFALRTDLDARLAPCGTRLSGRTRLRAGARRHVSLAYVARETGVLPTLGGAADARLDATSDWWRGWSAGLRAQGPFAGAVRQSALALKLLTSARSGAVMAAATTSLPEDAGGARNWDYRYCWLRDASLTVHAFVATGCLDEAGAFLDWLLHATRRTHPRLRVLYDVHGRAEIPERELDHLEGWRGARPVRVGNAAHDQLQLDAYGQVVVAAGEFVRGGGRLDPVQARYIAALGPVVCRLWREPDAGIWEMRGQPRHFTHSKVLCWAALDCLVRLMEEGVLPGDPGPFRAEGARIAAFIEDRCLDPGRGYTAAAGTSATDASLLTLPQYGYVDARDPRFRRTFETIDHELSVGDALLLRYRPGLDGLGGDEAAFGICSFWAVEALARMGRRDEAHRRMRVLLSQASDLGFYAEELEPGTGRALGNYPQAFSHVGLILAAEALGQGPA
jgi:GH15 family glucan-1,4-alpha-glucosidase